MDKKTYYVSVNNGSILEDPTAFDYEFEINATEEELVQLKELFEQSQEEDQKGIKRAYLIPFVHAENSEGFEESLHQTYQMLHHLGTPKTKIHIESMNILQEFNQS